MSEIKVLLASIFTDRALMVRAEMDNDTVGEYAEAYRRGDKFPPLKVFKEGDKYLLVDGWHRFLAAKLAAVGKFHTVILFRGDRSKALEVALSSNSTHGLKRSNADKREGVAKALAAWPKLSNRAIAEKCGVSDPFVADIRGKSGAESDTRIGLDGVERGTRQKSPDCERLAVSDTETPEKPHISQPTAPIVPRRTEPEKPSQSGKPIHLLAIWGEIEGLYGKALNRLDELNRVCPSKAHSVLIAGTKKLMVDLSEWRESVKKT